VNPVPDPLIFFSGSAGNRTRASGSVAKTICPTFIQSIINGRTTHCWTLAAFSVSLSYMQTARLQDPWKGEQPVGRPPHTRRIN
jgi:hypothetical protein